MLGSDRFVFDTPNAIDEGDLPPAQPARKRSPSLSPSPLSSNSHLTSTPASPPADPRTPRESYQTRSSNLLSTDIDDVQLTHADASTAYSFEQQNNKYNEDDDEDAESQRFLEPVDHEEKKLEEGEGSLHQNHHSLPAVEEARTYAVSLLHSANKTSSKGRSSHDPFARTIPIALENDPCAPIVPHGNAMHMHPYHDSAPTFDDRKLHSSRHIWASKKTWGFALLLILSIMLIAVTVKVAKDANGNDEHGISAIPDSPLSRLEQTYNFVHKALLTDLDDLTTPGRAQYLAANWIAHLDALTLDVPVEMNTTEAQAFVQRFVLAVFYFSTRGSESWRNKAAFLTEQNECGWFDSHQQVVSSFGNGETYALGVTCNTDLEVVNLLLPSNGLQGSLPPEIGHLTALTLLSLPHNQLAQQIPDSMFNLVNLEYLDLKFNFLKGRIPNMFETMQDLQVLGLSNNYLDQALPPSMAFLSKLKTLAIDDNALEGDLSAVANSMTSLEYLYADRNNLSGAMDDAFLKDLTQLKELDLSGNQFTATTEHSFPRHLLQHPTLTTLDVSSNALGCFLPAGLEDNHVIQFLSLRDNKLTGIVEETSLPLLRGLNHLDISGNMFPGQLPLAMAQLVGLSYLFVGNNPFWSPGPVPSWLYELKQIKELGMSNMQLTNDVPFWLSALTNMIFLDISGNQLSGAVPRQIFDLPNLKYLLLHNNSLVGELPSYIVGAEKLEMITLYDNSFYGSLEQVCQEAPSLELFAVDCGHSVDCNPDCCPQCCDRSSENGFCFQEAVPTYLQFFEGLWELNYTRATQSFNPSLISDLPNPYQIRNTDNSGGL